MTRSISRPLLLLLPILSLTIAGGSLFAQSRTSLSLALFGGYEFGAPLSITREPGVINRGTFTMPGEGSSENHIALAGIDLIAPRLLGREHGLMLRVEGMTATGAFYSERYSQFDDVLLNGTPVTGSVNEFVVDAHERQVRGALLYQWRPSGGATLALGPWVGVRLFTDITQQESIIDPPGATFMDGSTTRLLASLPFDASLESSDIRSGGLATVAADLYLGGGIALRPELTARFDAEALFYYQAGLSALSAGATIGIVFGAEAPTTTPRIVYDTILPPAPSFALSASVDLYSAGSDAHEGIARDSEGGLELRSIHTTRYRYLPIIPRIALSSDPSRPLDDLIPVTRDQAAAFSSNALLDLEPSGIQRHLLNVIGERMNEDASVAITLHADPVRASAVRDYLADVWSIDAARIAVAADRASDEAITITSNEPSLFAPVVQKWIVEEYAAPRIGLTKEITAEAGLKRWDISISHRDRELARYSSDEDLPEEATLPSTAFAAGAEAAPLVALMIAEDYTGTRDTAVDRIDMIPSPSPAVERERRSFWLLDPGISPEVDAADQALLRLIAATTEQGSSIVITSSPETESSGSGWNRQEVARKVLIALAEKGIRPRELRISDPDPIDIAPSLAWPGVRIDVEHTIDTTERPWNRRSIRRW